MSETPEEKNIGLTSELSYSDGDEALKAVIGGQDVHFSEDDNARLLRKIDWNIQPLLCIIYGLQYLDKTTLSYASIMGLRTDTNLGDGQYQWLGSIFYLGYLVWEYPANRLMQRLPLAKYTAVNVILWGAVLCCMAAGRNFSDLMAIRFLLGVFEASVTPGFTLFTSQWYRTSEQGSRTGLWFSFNGFAQIVGGLIAYGLARADHLTIDAWKVVFILTGCLTIAFGILLFIYMPDSPLTARWLSEDDRVRVIERIRTNQQGIGNKHFKSYQVWEALRDPITWLLVTHSLIWDIPNGGITNFFSILVESFGFTAPQSLLYSTPGGAVEAIAILGFLWLGDRFKKRLLFAAFGETIALLGILLVYALPDHLKVGRLIGFYLTFTSVPGIVVTLSLVSSNVAGYTKKTTVSAMVLIAYCVGNLIGPQLFRDQDAPRYTPALIAIVVCWSICIALLLTTWTYNVAENRRRDRLAEQVEGRRAHRKNQEFLDLTDRENQDFRYVT